MRQDVQVYATIKLRGLGQRFEESDEGDREMGFGVVHCYSIMSDISTIYPFDLTVCNQTFKHLLS